MKTLIETIAKALVDDEASVNVEEVLGSETVVIELKVAKGDVGKVIGKQGKNAQAMRTLLGAYAAKLRKRAVLEIIE